MYIKNLPGHTPQTCTIPPSHMACVGANKLTSLWVRSIRTAAYANLNPQRVSSYLELHSRLDKVYEIEIIFGITYYKEECENTCGIRGLDSSYHLQTDVSVRREGALFEASTYTVYT